MEEIVRDREMNDDEDLNHDAKEKKKKRTKRKSTAESAAKKHKKASEDELKTRIGDQLNEIKQAIERKSGELNTEKIKIEMIEEELGRLSALKFLCKFAEGYVERGWTRRAAVFCINEIPWLSVALIFSKKLRVINEREKVIETMEYLINSLKDALGSEVYDDFVKNVSCFHPDSDMSIKESLDGRTYIKFGGKRLSIFTNLLHVYPSERALPEGSQKVILLINRPGEAADSKKEDEEINLLV